MGGRTREDERSLVDWICVNLFSGYLVKFQLDYAELIC